MVQIEGKVHILNKTAVGFAEMGCREIQNCKYSCVKKKISCFLCLRCRGGNYSYFKRQINRCFLEF